MRRWFSIVLWAVLTPGVCGLLFGCDAQQVLEQVERAADGVAQNVSRSSAAAKPAETLRIASFNIQVFGVSKAGKPEVMARLAEIIRRFDVVAVQEIRSKDPQPVYDLLSLINENGGQYRVSLGPRLGRTVSKEQYAFYYDAERVQLARNTVYTLSDRGDWLHREPYVARFRARGVTSGVPFSFTLVNIHTDPDEADLEVDALDDALRAVWNDGSGEDDVILLGDLNADEYSLGELGEMPGIRWVVSGETTNVRRTEQYDNILFDHRRTTEFTGHGGVLDFRREFRLDEEQALDISDHFPVWAEFSRVEGSRPLLAERETERR